MNNSKKEKKKKNKTKMKEILNDNNYMDNLFIKKVKKITNKKNN
jgi:hypothetical protein